MVTAETKGHDPVADPAAVVTAGTARFTVLTPALIRMEWSATATFEDRASLAFLNRRLPVPAFQTDREDDWLVIRTDELTLRYRTGTRRFDENNLSVALVLNDRPVVWRPGVEDTGNLRGTCRTLDMVCGATALEPGLLSRDGWVVVDDSTLPLFERRSQTEWPWVAPRDEKDAIDWYFFGYGHDYTRALRDFTRVAGRVPMPPRFAFGSWWSRYWPYSDRDLKELVAGFREHDVPLDVLVIDIDWHLDGWTGYTWNPKYFPDPEGFLKWAHEQGLRTTLNLHPHSGVKKHEEAFPEVARHMGLDPDKVDRVPFDCADRRYVDAYFKYLHHPKERQGIDFWWIDWQQGEKTGVEALDPLFWLNYLHWTDMERNAERHDKRPFLFSRWGGLGNHRYQIGFSGDTHSCWTSLAFQPYFTATAGNVGFGYWSHDIGGHQPGPVDPELYARWIQWGTFSPALRTHTTRNPRGERRIWKFSDEVFRAARESFHLRYALIPYIYTTARQCYDTGQPLCRPLYYEWAELEQAYARTDEYLFGDQLLVAPVAKPASEISGCADVSVWIPPGQWTHWFTGKTYTGPSDILLPVPLDEMPVFARSGAIIPMQPKMSHTGERPVDPLILHIWPGESGETRIYEDDGETVGYQNGACSWTPVSHEIIDGVRRIVVGPVDGSYAGMLNERSYEIHLRDVPRPSEVKLDGTAIACRERPDGAGWWYEPRMGSAVIRLPKQSVRGKLELSVGPVTPSAGAPLPDRTRGSMKAVKNVVELLAGTPQWPSVRDKARQRCGASTADDMAAKLAPVDLLDIVQTVDLDARTRRRAIARLLGLAVDVRASGSRADQNRLNVVGTISVSLSTISLKEYDVEFALVPPPGWQVRGKHRWKLTGLKPDEPVTVSTALEPNGSLQTAALRADFSLKTDSLRLDVPLKKLLLPSINRWWVVGPFEAPKETGLDTIFPPESQVDLRAEYEGKSGAKVSWRKVERPITPEADLTEEFVVNFHDVFGEYVADAMSYAVTYLHAPKEMDVVLALGSDDGVVVWLNGNEVYRLKKWRPYESKEDHVPVRLKKGTNELLLKINQADGGWAFCVHVETPDGKPITEVEALLEP